MNTKLYLPVLALALTTVACGGGKKMLPVLIRRIWILRLCRVPIFTNMPVADG